MNDFKKNKNIKIKAFIFLFIIAVAIFLRTYHFEQWLQFNPDQVRDANVVSAAIRDANSLPLLGSVAGGTSFHLGPIFYYFQYVSAFVFGNAPDKMAYPDLLFSILSIGLLLLFLGKYFTWNVSLALTALMSVSYFAVFYSRFAWNPNSIPFFVLLFLIALLKMMNSENEKVYYWFILAGIAIGVGVQLHTLLLLMMPVVTFIVLVYLLWNKKLDWKNVLIVFLIVFCLNLPQLISEYKTRGANTKEFFLGSVGQVNSKSESVSNFGKVISCQAVFNVHMLSSFENKEHCSEFLATDKASRKQFNQIPGNLTSKNMFALSLAFSALFSLGGYILLLYYFKREKDLEKKNFLGIIILYNIVSWVLLVPVGSHVTLRYYNILFFVPFVLLGLWQKLLKEKTNKIGQIISMIFFVFFIVTNLFVVLKSAAPYAQNEANSGDNAIIGETKVMAEYIAKKTNGQSVAYLTGEKIYVRRFFPAFGYILKGSGLNLVEVIDGDLKKEPLFFIANIGQTKYVAGDEIEGCKIKDIGRFNNITIFNLSECQQ